VVMTPVAPIAGTVSNRTATTDAATIRTPLRSVRILDPFSYAGSSVVKRITSAEDAQPRNVAPWSAAVTVADHGDREQQGRRGDQLAAHDDPVDVDRRTPVDIVAVDHEGACGPCVHAESASGAGALALGAFAATATRPALHPGRRDHRDPVLLVRIAE